MLDELKKLRKKLHQNPELSGYESNTASRIIEFIGRHNDAHIIENIGGYGLAIIFDNSRNNTDKGPTIMIRCELDALPIDEKNIFEHRSTTKGISHKCGHDGHMAILTGLALWLKNHPLNSGKIILLFQPAEETGEGALKVLNDEKFIKLKPDYIFALHNIPGAELHSIITLANNFSPTVQSIKITLTGKISHASEPENGINPSLAIAQIISKFSKLNIIDPEDEHFSILTPIHIKMGEISYGISPGQGELHYTIRTWTEEVMKKMKNDIEYILAKIIKDHKLGISVEWIEYFPATENDKTCNNLINNSAKVNGYTLSERPYPFRFGEDFGWFSRKYKVGMFGIGAGLDLPALHHEDYDFPDEIIETGINMFKEIITQIMATG